MASLPLFITRCAALVAFTTGSVFAQTLIVDRGLPTTNLNGTGANRSNAAWRSANTPTAGYDAFVLGDRFNVGDPFSGQTILISQISLWVVKSAEATFANFDFNSSASYELLLSDLAANKLLASQLLNPETPVSVNYAGGQDYETPSGAQIDLLRLDFKLNLEVAPGSTLYFGVAGFDLAGDFLAPAVHASNAGLSGSVQQGADGLFYLFGSASPYIDFDGLATVNSQGTFWNKSSDVNVQVFASAVPEPSTYGMVAIGALAAVVGYRRFRAKRAGAA